MTVTEYLTTRYHFEIERDKDVKKYFDSINLMYILFLISSLPSDLFFFPFPITQPEYIRYTTQTSEDQSDHDQRVLLSMVRIF